jgi:hypothetical protein
MPFQSFAHSLCAARAMSFEREQSTYGGFLIRECQHQPARNVSHLHKLSDRFGVVLQTQSESDVILHPPGGLPDQRLGDFLERHSALWVSFAVSGPGLTLVVSLCG